MTTTVQIKVQNIHCPTNKVVIGYRNAEGSAVSTLYEQGADLTMHVSGDTAILVREATEQDVVDFKAV